MVEVYGRGKRAWGGNISRCSRRGSEGNLVWGVCSVLALEMRLQLIQVCRGLPAYPSDSDIESKGQMYQDQSSLISIKYVHFRSALL